MPIAGTTDNGTQQQIYYVSKGAKASDSNAGTDINSPLATVAQAVTLGNASGAPYTIQVGQGTWAFTISGHQPLFQVTQHFVIRGLGEDLTTLATEAQLTANGTLFGQGVGVDFRVEDLTFTGPSVDSTFLCSASGVTGMGTPGPSGSSGKHRYNRVTWNGIWAGAINIGTPSGTLGWTADVMVDQCTFDLAPSALSVAGIPIGVYFGHSSTTLGADAGLDSRLIVTRSKFLRYGATGSNQSHGIYCYPSVSMWVHDCSFGTQAGTGYAIQIFHATTETPRKRPSITACEFEPTAGAIYTQLAPYIEDCTFYQGSALNLGLSSPNGQGARVVASRFLSGQLAGGYITGAGRGNWFFDDCLFTAPAPFTYSAGSGSVIKCTSCVFAGAPASAADGTGLNTGTTPVLLRSCQVGAPFTLDEVTWPTGSTTVTSRAAGFTTNMNGLTVTGPGIPAATTFTYVSASTGTLSQTTTTAGTGLAFQAPTTGRLDTDARGTAVLVAGTVTVTTPAITANSIVELTVQTAGGTQGFLSIGTRVAGTSFVINSTSATETSKIGWAIKEPT